jgi:hypothetical protein
MGQLLVWPSNQQELVAPVSQVRLLVLHSNLQEPAVQALLPLVPSVLQATVDQADWVDQPLFALAVLVRQPVSAAAQEHLAHRQDQRQMVWMPEPGFETYQVPAMSMPKEYRVRRWMSHPDGSVDGRPRE